VCSSCTAIANCDTETCTTNADQVCTACSANFYLAGGTCTPCSGACPAGEYQSAACTATTDRACTSCTAIANCTDETCTTTTDQVCTACAGGFYLDAGNNTCVACTTSACPSGQFQSAACSATADRVCSSCTTISDCSAETCTTASNQTCSSCDNGFYASGQTCAACTASCPDGEFETAACTGTADIQCAGCTAIPHCSAETCTTDSDQTCTTCDVGYTNRGGSCTTLAGTGTVSDPFNSSPPLATCKAYKAQYGALATTGVYTIDTDDAGSRAPFDVYCEQTMDGGGWILALSRPISGIPTWGCLTPGAPPTGPANNTTTVVDYGAFAEAGVGEMLLMGGQKIIKFYYPRPGVSFQVNYRLFTERNCYDPNHFASDAPHTGTTRDGIGHLNDACTTSDFAIFKAKDSSCPRDSTNSHNGLYNGSWGNCPGCGTSPPTPTPNCWFYGGSQASNLPSLSSCPVTSRASWGDYTTGDMTGNNYVLFVR
jgi:hypothetical protein